MINNNQEKTQQNKENFLNLILQFLLIIFLIKLLLNSIYFSLDRSDREVISNTPRSPVKTSPSFLAYISSLLTFFIYLLYPNGDKFEEFVIRSS